jgi:hypothetical protein
VELLQAREEERPLLLIRISNSPLSVVFARLAAFAKSFGEPKTESPVEALA